MLQELQFMVGDVCIKAGHRGHQSGRELGSGRESLRVQRHPGFKKGDKIPYQNQCRQVRAVVRVIAVV